jgi:hypothetical protein
MFHFQYCFSGANLKLHMKFQYARLSKEAFAARAEVNSNSEQGIVRSLSESLEAS